jgi:hypothetical protein
MFYERVDDRRTVLAVVLEQHEIARLALYKGHDLSAPAATQHVVLPITGHRTVLRRSRPLTNRQRVRDSAMVVRILRMVPRTLHGSFTPQVFKQLLFKRTAGLYVQVAMIVSCDTK